MKIEVTGKPGTFKSLIIIPMILDQLRKRGLIARLDGPEQHTIILDDDQVIKALRKKSR